MVNICFIVEYHGAKFCGWQSQPGNVPAIQDELRKAIGISLRTEIGPLVASGRTDAGVHARRQVVNFKLKEVPDLNLLAYSVSCIMRRDLAVLYAFEVPENFHAQRDAERKCYRYRILLRNSPPTLSEGQVWHLRGPIDLEMLFKEAPVFIGTHDFSSFRNHGCSAKSPVRTIYESQFIKCGDELIYQVIGKGFLKQMVRNIVGTLVDHARGRVQLSADEILKRCDRRVAGVTAPANGLRLEWVKYPQGIRSELERPWEF